MAQISYASGTNFTREWSEYTQNVQVSNYARISRFIRFIRIWCERTFILKTWKGLHVLQAYSNVILIGPDVQFLNESIISSLVMKHYKMQVVYMQRSHNLQSKLIDWFCSRWSWLLNNQLNRLNNQIQRSQ